MKTKKKPARQVKVRTKKQKIAMSKIEEARANPTPMDYIKQIDAQFEKIYDEYIEEFGLNKTYKRYLRTLQIIAKLQLKYIETGDNFQLT